LLCAQRFPQWMWRNRSVERFVAWLRAHNLALPESERTRRAAGLYGMGEGPI
jgi:erythromycin esterase-like protein